MIEKSAASGLAACFASIKSVWIRAAGKTIHFPPLILGQDSGRSGRRIEGRAGFVEGFS
jgi:hypothetical protein